MPPASFATFHGPAAQIWALLRPFDGLQHLLSSISDKVKVSITSEGVNPAEVGCERTIDMGDGSPPTVEKLVGISDREHWSEYTLVDSALIHMFGIKNYVARVTCA